MPQSSMRVIEGIEPPNEMVRFTFRGRECTGWSGESIASAIMRAGILTVRRTRIGDEARGYYCGMGLCWECAVHVEGLGIVRSCCQPVSDGQVISFADSEWAK